MAVGRSRGGVPARGTAIPRANVTGLSFPLFGPWGRWFPWYTSGFGWNLGYVGFNPWLYGGTQWVWGRYGLWYDPFDPWNSYYGGYGSYIGGAYGYGGGYAGDSSAGRPETGSIRLRVKPTNAKVYIDGGLVGVVSDFDGLTGHLSVAAGAHELELRADGYETYTADITVKANATTTERFSLKKK
jgi:hypothetical protein